MSNAEALVRVRALLVDPMRTHLCPCGNEPMIRPEDLAKAVRGN